MATASIEERFAALEAEVARLRVKVEGQNKPSIAGERYGVSGRTSPDFLDTVFGIHANSPAFEEVTRQIEAEREHEREEARQLRDQDEAVA